MNDIPLRLSTSKNPRVRRVVAVIIASGVSVTQCYNSFNILGGERAWATLARSGDLSLINTRDLARFLNVGMDTLMPQMSDIEQTTNPSPKGPHVIYP